MGKGAEEPAAKDTRRQSEGGRGEGQVKTAKKQIAYTGKQQEEKNKKEKVADRLNGRGLVLENQGGDGPWRRLGEQGPGNCGGSRGGSNPEIWSVHKEADPHPLAETAP